MACVELLVFVSVFVSFLRNTQPQRPNRTPALLLVLLVLLSEATVVVVVEGSWASSTPRVATDAQNNLVIDAGEGHNITATAHTMFVNGEQVATTSALASSLASLQSTLAQLNASLYADAVVLTQLSSALSVAQTDNQRLRDSLAILNTTTLTTQQQQQQQQQGQYTQALDASESKLTTLTGEVCGALPALSSLSEFQQMDTIGAHHWEHFTINTTHYLAVASLNNGNAFNISSNIYRFDASLSQYVLLQQLNTLGATDMEFFTINNTSYLAVANHRSNTTFNILSSIYRFNATTSLFTLYQQLNTSGARG